MTRSVLDRQDGAHGRPRKTGVLVTHFPLKQSGRWTRGVLNVRSPAEQGSISTRWRIPYWFEWVVALAGAVTLLNINVTSAGDPLSGSGGGVAGPGITASGRTAFYVSLALFGAVLAGAFIVTAFVLPVRQRVAVLGVRTFGVVAFAGIAGLLFDYRDGPVRLVQSVAYFALTLGAVRLVAVAVGVSESDGPSYVASVPENARRAVRVEP